MLPGMVEFELIVDLEHCRWRSRTMAYVTSLRRDLVFLILQFLDEEKFRDTAHKWVFRILSLCFHCFLGKLHQ